VGPLALLGSIACALIAARPPTATQQCTNARRLSLSPATQTTHRFPNHIHAPHTTLVATLRLSIIDGYPSSYPPELKANFSLAARARVLKKLAGLFAHEVERVGALHTMWVPGEALGATSESFLSPPRYWRLREESFYCLATVCDVLWCTGRSPRLGDR